MVGKGNQEENKMSLEAAGWQGGPAHEANDSISHSSATVPLPGFPPHCLPAGSCKGTGKHPFIS